MQNAVKKWVGMFNLAIGGISFAKILAGSLGVVAVLPCPPAAVPGRAEVAVAAGVSCAQKKMKKRIIILPARLLPPLKTTKL